MATTIGGVEEGGGQIGALRGPVGYLLVEDTCTPLLGDFHMWQKIELLPLP